ncbi:Hypothetical protein R9X50_00430500 [Acrodontium crateriforme]|uniref:Cation/H+ exchanger transmembrane domain-containing protein n=1 Tax=Acrodontium crateriforme TaxID=150365 RepID=A0AAQ3M4H9_9PEZI|nr:Hypothetical protein R9X50_00430500 [Acrodontium crateriforme]
METSSTNGVHVNGAWSQIEASPPHLTYLLLSTFLISYALFTSFIRNRLHLSEPPIALAFGILLGPRVFSILTPNTCGLDGCLDPNLGPGGWGWGDGTIQEITRVIVGIQVFAVGVELPKRYASRHWRSILMLLGPVMTIGWLVCAGFVALLFGTDLPTSLVIAACLTPTDPVLAASILSNSQFSNRVPPRIKHMLSAESGCNDGISFPFLYIGLFILTQENDASAFKSWFLITILWQCVFGTILGLVIGTTFNRLLRFSDKKGYIDDAGFTVFYLLLAVLSVGVGSTLGADDFLVSFGAGYGFARDGWFSEKTKEARLPKILDLLFNSAMFVYLGTIIPWYDFVPQNITISITPIRLIGFLVLVLLFRRIPAVLLTWRWIPDIHTWHEAFFCGHFGPMGLGGLFLAIEARAVLENGTAIPDAHPPHYGYPYTAREKAVMMVWPIVCFTVMGSTIVHGLSVLVISIASHFSRSQERRAGLLAAEDDPLGGMNHEPQSEESEESESETENQLFLLNGPNPNMAFRQTDVELGDTIILFAGPSLKAIEFDGYRLDAHSPYWHRHLRTSAMPSFEQRRFPEFDEVAMTLFAKWISGETLHGPNELHSGSHYVTLYILACRFECESLQNRVMDLTRDFYRDKNLSASPHRLEYIYRNVPSSDAMRRFLVATAAYRLLVEKSGEHNNTGQVAASVASSSAAIEATVDRDPFLADDLQRALVHLSREGLPDPRRGLHCT